MNTEQAPIDALPLLLTKKQTAHQLGVSPRTVNRMVRAGIIQGVPAGKRRNFRREEVLLLAEKGWHLK